MENTFDIILHTESLNGNYAAMHEKIISDLKRVLVKVLRKDPHIADYNDTAYTMNSISDKTCCLLFQDDGFNAENIPSLKGIQHVFNLLLGNAENTPVAYENYPTYVFNKQAKDGYWMNLVNLSYEIKKITIPQNRESKAVQSEKKVIFTHITQRELFYKDLIKSELQNYHYTELLNVDFNAKIPENTEAIITILPTVQNTSQPDSTLLLEQLKNIADTNKGIKHFIWIPMETEEPDNKLLNEIKARQLAAHSETLYAPVEVFKSLVIKRMTEQEKQSDDVNGTNPELIYLMHDRGDKKVSLLQTELKKKGMHVICSEDVIKAKNPVREHRNTLLKSVSIIIHYPEKNRPWLQSKFYDLVKSPGYGKNIPFKSKFLLTPEMNGNINENLMNGIHIFTYKQEIDKELIEKITGKLV